MILNKSLKNKKVLKKFGIVKSLFTFVETKLKKMDILRKTQLIKSVEYLSLSLPYLDEIDKATITSIIKDYTTVIDKYNNKNIEVINPTKTELGRLNQSKFHSIESRVFKDIKNDFKSKSEKISDKYKKLKAMHDDKYEHIYKKDDEEKYKKYYEYWNGLYYRERKEIGLLNYPYSKIHKLVTEYKFTEDYISAKILLSRNSPAYHQWGNLTKETSQFLINNMVKDFVNKNEKQINQIKINYETSK